MLLRPGVALIPATLLACSDDAPPASCRIGDPAQAIELAAVHWSGDGAAVDLADGGEVDLLRPLQGGKVIYVGVRARNLESCELQLTAALRDPAGNQVIALEQRPVQLAAGADGWGWPASPFDHLANVPACPSAAAAVDVDGAAWTLELRLDEAGGRSATTSLTVRPRCARADELDECRCECDSDYELGSACPGDAVDAGVD